MKWAIRSRDTLILPTLIIPWQMSRKNAPWFGEDYRSKLQCTGKEDSLNCWITDRRATLYADRILLLMVTPVVGRPWRRDIKEDDLQNLRTTWWYWMQDGKPKQNLHMREDTLAAGGNTSVRILWSWYCGYTSSGWVLPWRCPWWTQIAGDHWQIKHQWYLDHLILRDEHHVHTPGPKGVLCWLGECVADGHLYSGWSH